MAEQQEPFRWFGKVPKSWLPFQIAVGGAWAIIIVVAIATCGESTAERETRIAAEAAESAAAEARYAEQEAARKAETERKRVALRENCTPELDVFGELILVRVAAPLSVLVDQDLWDSMSLDERTGFSAWAAVCKLNDTVVLILHGRTGEQIAHFSVDGGYRTDE